MTAPTLHDQSAMRVRAKRFVRDFKPAMWMDFTHPTNTKRWTELLSNTGFETAGAGGADVFANWTETVTGSSTVVDNTIEMDAGSHCCELSVVTTGYAGVSQNVLTVGKTYTVELRMKASSASAIAKITGHVSAIPLTTSYQTFTYTFVATVGYVEVARANTGTWSIYIDSVYCTEVKPVEDADPIYSVVGRNLAANTFSQATAALRPVYETATLSLVLDGSNDVLGTTTMPLSGTDGRVVAVVRTGDATRGQAVYSQSDKDAVDVYLSLGVTSDNKILYDYCNGVTRHTIKGDTVLGTGWHVLEWASDGSAISMLVDGVAQALTVTAGSNAGNWFGDLTNDDTALIGAQQTSLGTSLYLDGNIQSVVSLEPDESAGNVTRMRNHILTWVATLALGMWFVASETDVYAYTDAGNGAGAMWTFGNTLLVRHGTKLIASGFESDPTWDLLANAKWTLWEKDGAGDWTKIKTDTAHTREPSPIGVTSDGSVWLSAAPADNPAVYSGTVTPSVIQFPASDLTTPTATHVPTWDGTPTFYTHTYRSFAVDRDAGTMLSIYNVDMSHCEWTYRNAAGSWAAKDQLVWPWGADYETPQAIRLAYPAVQLKGGKAYFCGVSDIVEPNSAWKAFKLALTGETWDYDFRRLFFSWTDDITSEPFHDWVEIASREATCGWLTMCDMYVDGDGDCHLLWVDKAIDPRLRSTFFPNERQSYSLRYAVVSNGVVVSEMDIVRYEEGSYDQQDDVRFARFHIMPSGRVFIVYHDTTYVPGMRSYFMRVVELLSTGGLGRVRTLPVDQCLTTWYTPSVRAGCAASETIDMLGERRGASLTLSHVSLELIGETA